MIGKGRLPEVEEIVGQIHALFGRSGGPLRGRRVVVTAGGTHEPLDPVRYIGNRASGRMGYALAAAARDLGAHVTLISGPVSLPTPPGVARVDVRTAREMFDAVKKDVKGADVFISVAAVADYRVKNPSKQKIKKGNGAPRLELEENPDILAWVASQPKAPFCVGFAAESENLAANAKAKLAKKKVPLIAANIAQDTMGRDDNAITLYDAEGEHPLGHGPKLDLARRLIEQVALRLK